jgi:hypothetical protein
MRASRPSIATRRTAPTVADIICKEEMPEVRAHLATLFGGVKHGDRRPVIQLVDEHDVLLMTLALIPDCHSVSAYHIFPEGQVIALVYEAFPWQPYKLLFDEDDLSVVGDAEEDVRLALSSAVELKHSGNKEIWRQHAQDVRDSAHQVLKTIQKVNTTIARAPVLWTPPAADAVFEFEMAFWTTPSRKAFGQAGPATVEELL